MTQKSHLCMLLWVLTGCFYWSPSLSRESCLMAGRSHADTGTRLASAEVLEMAVSLGMEQLCQLSAQLHFVSCWIVGYSQRSICKTS
ncbi:uncharacterized protein M421DRAFT_250706 [Didymella exigua CBS 183.55]|uniref:Secreted protein n=1 Tax=Didymella exigua CBS 183.55 TaxID=1150837 RepID=A0A6A5RWH1_9PLEO|nr:uncharacterized protein M421DRAFT_250706 [Didymella exigua CBS 183.55]KAF1932835.1 hypothetical protein M421DRAFT_250706 [Didymella exigua CBS 183.55]